MPQGSTRSDACSGSSDAAPIAPDGDADREDALQDRGLVEAQAEVQLAPTSAR